MVARGGGTAALTTMVASDANVPTIQLYALIPAVPPVCGPLRPLTLSDYARQNPDARRSLRIANPETVDQVAIIRQPGGLQTGNFALVVPTPDADRVPERRLYFEL